MSQIINIENTNFIWKTNLAGDPTRDKFGSAVRKASILLTPELADDLRQIGLNVSSYTFKDENGDPGETVEYINFTLKYDSKMPPEVYLVDEEMNAVLIPAEAVSMIDNIKVKNVCGSFNVYTNPKTGKTSLYCRQLFVEQDTSDNIFASRYNIHR